MSSKDSWKEFQTQLQKLTDKNKSLQNNLKKYDSSKQTDDNSKVKDTICKDLDEAKVLLNQLQASVDKTQHTLGNVEENTDNTRREKKMDPEDSEATYQFKAQMMKNIESQNSRLQVEISLHEKMAEVRHLNHQNKKLQEESRLSHTNMVKLLQRFEKKAKETDQKLKALEDEVARSNALAFRYKDMLDQERGQRNRGKGSNNEREKTIMPAISGIQQSTTSVNPNVKASDVIRRNETLMDDNETLKREIGRLRQDNAMLLKKVKFALADRDTMQHELETCKLSREDIAKRYHKEKQQHQLLSKSMTRQAQEFVLAKRQQQQLEESSRWKVVYNEKTGPISPFGPAGRIYSNPARSSGMSRSVLPVQDYPAANESTA